MQKMIWFMFVIVMFHSFALARPVLVMDDNVKKTLKIQNRIDTQYENQNDKNKEKRKSFIVEVDETSKKIFADLKKRFKNKYHISNVRKNTFRLKNEKVNIDLSDFDSNRFFCASKVLKTIMPNDYVNQFVLVSVDERRSFSMSQGVKIEGRTFNFKRVFNGRIVRNNDNYFNVRIDKNGYLESADIAMQDLKILAEDVEIDNDIDENEATLDSVLNADFEFAYIYDNNGIEKKEKIDNIEMKSVAEAYCEILEGKVKKLFPCLSYTSKINLSEKRNFDYIIDVPHSRKSWGDYHAKKSSATFGNHRY